MTALSGPEQTGWSSVRTCGGSGLSITYWWWSNRTIIETRPSSHHSPTGSFFAHPYLAPHDGIVVPAALMSTRDERAEPVASTPCSPVLADDSRTETRAQDRPGERACLGRSVAKAGGADPAPWPAVAAGG
jgi:hypothetical protein